MDIWLGPFTGCSVSMTAASRLSVKHGRVAHVRRGKFRPGFSVGLGVQDFVLI